MKSADLSDRPGRAAPPRAALCGAFFWCRRFAAVFLRLCFLRLCFLRLRAGAGERAFAFPAPARLPALLLRETVRASAVRYRLARGRCRLAQGRCRKFPSIAAKSPLQGKRGQDFILQCFLFRCVRIKRLRKRPPGQKNVSCRLLFGCFAGQGQPAIPLSRAF